MTDKETMKCIVCKKELTTDDIVISSNTFAYCKKCKQPMLDMLKQPPEHFLKRHEDEIEHDTCMNLLFRGYV